VTRSTRKIVSVTSVWASSLWEAQDHGIMTFDGRREVDDPR